MADGKRFDYERSDVGLRLVGWLAGGLATFVAVTPLVLPLMYPQSMKRITPASRPALSSNAPPLEVTPRDALQKSRQADEQIERGYGWADRNRGEVRIPIDRAVEILLRKGLPGWPSP
ncbi:MULTISPECIES: hypothetical protein [unclassified Bradyrhizobium]|uniref:hypothetical protein n=1 Tax=unclassified Bradyrhizobium TaxID=2631580 RepID=UPI0024799896|nr:MULTISPECIES: hypothetical protein [unclassified Bradyrhizobium]WGR70539.1 hypothetical protein MTX24_35285 [Bradyrhizobium sp. ISRA426]WGR75376.1 hypothetical protein MTX21_20385 [Bradyrhizobium sp. ISRA430]WGR85780.1 hypothetical protein MTX25_34970 [Bradyrhizobium sp. ISRA432]